MEVGQDIYINMRIPAKNLDNFLGAQDVRALKLVETTGTVLPYLIIAFTTFNSEVMNCIKQNNVVEVTFGKSKDKADTFPVSIRFSKINQDQSGNGWTIVFGGFIYGKTFMVDQQSKSYDGNSLLVAKQVIKEAFNKDIITDIEKVEEKQVHWLRTNLSSCLFLMDVLLHMDIHPSFPLFTFDKFGNFKLRSFDNICKEGAKYNIVPRQPANSKELMYMNNFQLKSYKHSYDIYTGYDRNVEITDSNSGKTSTEFNINTPMLAATQEVERSEAGSTTTMNEIQSGNVHNTYKAAYKYNTDKMFLLSSMAGEVILAGDYYRDISPLDLVNLQTGNTSDGGFYIIDTVSTFVNFAEGTIKTSLYLSRDNYNYIENYIESRKGLNILRRFMLELAEAVHDLKVAYAFALEVIDGEYMERWLSFAVATKTNLLRSFSIAGVPIDFNSQANLLTSLIRTGNSLMNTLIDMVFPESIAYTLQDFIINKPSLLGLISRYVAEYVPLDLQSIIMSMATSLFKTTNSLNSIAKDNGIKVTTEKAPIGEAAELVTTETSEIDYKEEGQDRVEEIIRGFENNTTGLDIPYPIIELSESQSLYSEKELRNYIATATIENLTNLGYLKTDKDQQDLKEILLGEKPIDFNLINRINGNAGYTYNYRYWGVFGETQEAMYAWGYEDKVVYTKTEEINEKTRLFNYDYSPYSRIDFKVDKIENTYVITYKGNIAERKTDLDITTNALAELTSFNIKKSYKDKYRTIPCTKIISASKNQRIYFACPKKEEDLKFYINAKRVELPSFEIDLGYVDAYNVPIIYNVYYTETGFNSNSVLFEIKKGGMV